MEGIALGVTRRSIRGLRKAHVLLPKRWRTSLRENVLAPYAMQTMVAQTDDFEHTTWLGKRVWQNPSDAWLIQEVICEQRPDVIVETGSFLGGSAFFVATVCDAIGHGEIVTVELDIRPQVEHPRITYLLGSSTDPEIVERIRAQVAGRSVLVVLDSNHSPEHVYDELVAYAPMVKPGGYIHVQDGMNGGILGYKGAGPERAAQRFLAEQAGAWSRDEALERKYVFTHHPWGWLRRVRPVR